MCAHLGVELSHVVPALAHDEGTEAAVHRAVIAHQTTGLEGVIGLKGEGGGQKEHSYFTWRIQTEAGEVDYINFAFIIYMYI